LKRVDELSPGNVDAEKLRARSSALQAEVLKKATEEQRKQKATEHLQKFDTLLTEGNLPEAEARLTAAAELDGALPELKPRQERLAQKKLEWKQQFEGLLKDAEDALADEARLAEAGKKIDAAAHMAADDKRVQSLRERFVQSKTAADTRERTRQKREKLGQDLKTLEQTLPAPADPQAESKLATARAKFAELTRGYESDSLLRPFNEVFEQKKTAIQHVKFEGMLKNVDEMMDKDLSNAEQTFASAKAMFPNDPLLKPVGERLALRTRFAAALNGLNDMIIRNAKLDDIEAQFAVAENLFPKDVRLEPFRQKLQDWRKQSNFAALLASAQTRMKDDTQLAAAQASLDEAAKLYPRDTRLADLRQALTARQATVQKRVEQQAYMQKLANDVDSLMANDSTLTDADARVREGDRLYPGDPMLGRLRGRIQNRRAELHPAPVRRDPPREPQPLPTRDSQRAVDDIGETHVDR
jgi:hypothetical protein